MSNSPVPMRPQRCELGSPVRKIRCQRGWLQCSRRQVIRHQSPAPHGEVRQHSYMDGVSLLRSYTLFIHYINLAPPFAFTASIKTQRDLARPADLDSTIDQPSGRANTYRERCPQSRACNQNQHCCADNCDDVEHPVIHQCRYRTSTAPSNTSKRHRGLPRLVVNTPPHFGPARSRNPLA
jgi:hypothetical protein